MFLSQSSGSSFRTRFRQIIVYCQKIRLVSEKRVFLLILLLGITNGLVFIFLVPPWQHYDEPTQFEFAWLIANTQRLPKTGEYDQGMRREVAASMIEHRFFSNLDFKPNLLSQTEPVWIGISQTGDRPLYYILIAIPLYLLRTSDITFQLYAGRLVSLVLYLVIIFCGYRITVELTRSGNPLRWMIPLLLAAIPGFTDSMTSINNDVGAVAFFSLFLWSSILLIRRGFAFWRLAALIISAGLCIWTKNSVAVTAILSPIILLFSIATRKWKPVAWIVTGIILVSIALSVFSWGNAAHWFPMLFVEQQTREQNPQAPSGKYALALSIQPLKPAPRLIQIIRPSLVSEIAGKTVTLGAWMWASKPIVAFSPTILYGDDTVRNEINLTQTPAFVTTKAMLPENIDFLVVSLAPITGSNPKEGGTIFYDGVVLAEGDYPATVTPQFDNRSSSRGIWGGKQFTNLLVNGSGESGWPRIRVWADRLLARYIPIQPSTILASLLDWRVSGDYYLGTTIHMLQTFWGRFGWGNVVLLGFHPYAFLGIATALGLLGALIAGIRYVECEKGPLLEIGFVFTVTLLWIWIGALSRGVSSILGGDTFIPSARYAFPAILPTLLVLSVGWLELARIISRSMHMSERTIHAVFVASLLALDVLSYLSIARFYY